ncbi:MFS transporter [Paraburkholderia fynbosensis]|uniref:Major facilitator superfamily (MFS) profile domain-containing protein n=1 Tax=Paraburkholderia fynbosensis TaxID=1200993 RepID=A0A6J5H4K8_9BURK|nr:MFS transporter [Paraburkholderia fynbosensis]CAB3808862.1 hypothetical protein LMG27177_06665 [Paraburkholderia fynbosensis]
MRGRTERSGLDFPASTPSWSLYTHYVQSNHCAGRISLGEFIPKRHRGKTDSLILSGFPLGALLSAAVSYLVLNNLPADMSWRVGFGLGTTMALLFFWIRRVIPESSRWLLQPFSLLISRSQFDEKCRSALSIIIL